MKKCLILMAAFLAINAGIKAQENNQVNYINTAQLEARADWQHQQVGSLKDHDASGFKGKYLNVVLKGEIAPNLSYAYRQRLNRAHKSESFFDATDWLHLDWQATECVELSAGKQVVGIGGYEYDRAPIDLYTCSEYWNNIPCYALGVSAGLNISKGDKLVAQICESPFSRNDSIYGRQTGSYILTNNHRDRYAYNLMWYGSHGWFNTIYSVNMVEYMPGKYINYIALGHRLDFGKVALELDFMNRAAEGQAYLMKDCSVMGELSVKPSEKLNVFAKATYDVNKAERPADFCVLPGTEITMMGGGFEYFPLKDKSLRLHAVGSYRWGKNGNPDGVLQDKMTTVSVGLTWRANLFNDIKFKR